MESDGSISKLELGNSVFQVPAVAFRILHLTVSPIIPPALVPALPGWLLDHTLEFGSGDSNLSSRVSSSMTSSNSMNFTAAWLSQDTVRERGGNQNRHSGQSK
ncbi:hypothetical protein PVAP13_2KG252558 [Panicum virgatum]|uniref:Uncharacterized protein n=1 Tax=Panicum virgatum TaxID=38727 RepID=A0A8T0WDY3_PANVG|nr:hypothetical protein PVAP13_2KG252558 [Panicum virgatum]